MMDYVKKSIAGFPEEIKGAASTPAGEHLFKVRSKSDQQPLDKEQAQAFHTTVTRLLFVTTQYRRDIQTAVAFLCTRVHNPDGDDWKKLICLLQYLKGTVKLGLHLDVTNMSFISWWVDALFAVHDNFRSHTRACISLGKGAIMSMLQKQKLNTKSSTEAEVVAVDDASGQILWTNYFIKSQGTKVKDTTIYQDGGGGGNVGREGKILELMVRMLDPLTFFVETHCSTK